MPISPFVRISVKVECLFTEMSLKKGRLLESKSLLPTYMATLYSTLATLKRMTENVQSQDISTYGKSKYDDSFLENVVSLSQYGVVFS